MADDSEQIGAEEIGKLLAQQQQARPVENAPPSPRSASRSSASDHADESDTATLRQEEVEALLRQKQGDSTQPAPPSGGVPRKVVPTESHQHGESAGLPAGDIEFLFRQAEEALASVQAAQSMPPGAAPFKLADFGGTPASTESASLELLRDVELDLKIELGRTQMYLEDVLRLSKGAVVALDRLAGDPVDIYVNGRLIARGEVLILNDNFCVRVAELMAGESAVA
jgi:flagellar motor switch protein FliN/FliY